MRSLKVFDRSGKAISLKTAQIARAKWIGTNSPAEIFDSRPETAIELEPKEIKIAFQEEKKISGLKVWNGDQFSPGFFSERKPLSGLMVSSDSMSPKEYKLNTEAGAHVIHFSETMTTKNLILKPIERGHLSEIRFLEPAGDFFPWFESALQMTARPQTSQTEKEALSVFNRELASIDDAESWSFRFRSDGSVFVSGRIDQEKTAGKFVVNGRFKILEKKDRSMKVQVFGVRRALGIPWDGHDCGTQCFVNVRKNEIKISDTLLIEKKNGSWFVRNRNPARNRGLPFTDLKVKISSLVE